LREGCKLKLRGNNAGPEGDLLDSPRINHAEGLEKTYPEEGRVESGEKLATGKKKLLG